MADPRLRGCAALVTGGGSGMGRACALALAAEGASVAVLGRTGATLEEVAALVRVAGAEALAVVGDVASAADVRAAVETVDARFGRIDVLVNSAGTNTARRSLAETADEDWEGVIATNLSGIFRMTQAVLPVMRRQRGGTIVNISSLAAKGAVPIAGAAYSASKMGVNALTQLVNLEQWEYGIRATTIYPGETLTPLLLRRPVPVPLERRDLILRPDDVAAAVLYAVSQPARVLVEEIVLRPTTR
jgi:NAD(P)-dependent dehydrogenase (short-subunit alcohol dehydrogenase family)